jgi:hypothetical protein
MPVLFPNDRMRHAAHTAILAAASIVSLVASAPAQTLINGKDLSIRSTGAQSGNGWSLAGTGYLGTYVTVPAGGRTSRSRSMPRPARPAREPRT